MTALILTATHILAFILGYRLCSKGSLFGLRIRKDSTWLHRAKELWPVEKVPKESADPKEFTLHRNTG